MRTRNFDSKIPALARAFADNVLAALGKDKVDKVVSINSASHPDTCATHDFCDSNVMMLEAMESIGIAFDPADADQADLINRAWTLAKVWGFDPHHPALQDSI